MSRYDYRDPGEDPRYCDAHSEERDDSYTCPRCGSVSDDVMAIYRAGYWPYCSQACVEAADRFSEENQAHG